MKDSDIRGVVLRKFYDLRKDNCYHQLEQGDLGQIDIADYNRIGRQLEERGLIEWHASLSNDGAERITADGVDVIEGDTAFPSSNINSDNGSPVIRSHVVEINELNDIVHHLNYLKDRFYVSNKFGHFLDTGDQASFTTRMVEAKTLLSDTLGSNNNFERQLRAALLSGIGGPTGGPSKACVVEVEQLLRGALRAIERKQLFRFIETEKVTTKSPYVDPARMAELQSLQANAWDYTKLIRLCMELNIANQQDCHYAVAMLVRAITDHVPPLFRVTSFKQVVSNYGGTKSFKGTMDHLDTGLRKIADSFLHEQIRRREITPNATQVNFSQSLDLLLAEVVRIA